MCHIHLHMQIQTASLHLPVSNCIDKNHDSYQEMVNEYTDSKVLRVFSRELHEKPSVDSIPSQQTVRFNPTAIRNYLLYRKG